MNIKPLTVGKGGRTMSRVASHQVIFEQTDFAGRMMTSELTSARANISAVVYDHETHVRSQINVYDARTVDAEEVYLEVFEETSVHFRIVNENGGTQGITIFGLTATELIDALEAARMANTPQEQSELAQ